MEPHNIDSIFRKTVNESAGYYESEADQSKGSVWQQIQSGKKNRALPVLFRILVAACILLLFCTTFLAILLFREKKSAHMLAETNSILKTESSLQSPKTEPVKVTGISTPTNFPDTVYIKKDVVVYEPLVTLEKQVDTVYITQVVYKEREPVPDMSTASQSNSIMESLFPVPGQSSAKEILISNKQGGNVEKKGKIRLKLGGNNRSSGNGSLAFTVNL